MSDKDIKEKLSKKAIALYALLCLILSTLTSVLMYVFGSKIKLGSLMPFSDEAHRWYFIVAVIIIFIIIEAYLLNQYLKAKREDEKNAKNIKKTVFTQLDMSNQYALDRLKKNTKILALIKRNILYKTPWFLVLGKEGSGKTTLLDSFNLDEQKGEQAEDTFVNWTLSDHSVFIDIKGDVCTKENKKLWQHFVVWLSKKRAKRPINGVILTIGIDSFIHLSVEQRSQYAVVIRKELNRLNDTFGADIPIYIAVTKLDLLTGFAAFVNKLDGKELDDVLGLSFPFDAKADRITSWQASYQEQYDKLGQKLNSYVFYGQDDETTALNAKYYTFLQQMLGLREPIFEFIAVLLGEKHTNTKPFIRGVYFTAVNQHIDIVNAVEQRANVLYNLPDDAPTSTGGKPVNPPRQVQRGFFSEYFLEQLLIPEAGLAHDSQHEKLRVRKRHFWAYLITGIVIATLTTGWLYFYKKNKATGAQVLAAVKQYHASPKLVSPTKQTSSADYLNTLNLLRDSLDRYRKRQGFLINARNMGLYRGEKITQRLATTYQQLLINGFSKAIVSELVSELEMLRAKTAKNSSKGEAKYPKDALEMLRVIRLISESPKGKSKQVHDDLIAYRKNLVRPWMVNRWFQQYKNAANSSTIKNALLIHLDYVLVHTGVVLDESLSGRIAKLQADMSTVSLSNSLYQHLKNEARAKSPSAFNFAHELGGKFYEVFQTQASVQQGEDGFLIPRFFTRDGFTQYYINEQDNILKWVGLDYWVLGKKSSPQEYTDADDTHIRSKIRALYLSDYVDAWGANINALKTRNLGDMAAIINFLQVVSSKDSPYLGLIHAVRSHTIFTDMYPAENNAEKAADATAGKVVKTAKPSQTQRLAKAVSVQLQHDFQDINALAEKTGEQKAYMDDVQKVLKNLYKYMLAIQKETMKNKPGALTTFEKKQAEKGVENPIEALRRVAEGLPEPLRSQFQQVADACVETVVAFSFQDVDTAWQQGVYAYYQEHIKGKYPLVKSGADIPLANFKTFFAKNGILDKFYTQYIKSASQAASSDTGVALDSSLAPVLAFFEHVEYISKGFFTESGEYNINFSIEPVSLSNVYLNTVLDLHGEKIKYSHEKPVEKNIKWPAEGAKKTTLTLTPLDKDIANEIYASSGEWALFHLIDKTSTYKLNDQTRYIRFKGKAGVSDFKLTLPNPINPLTKDLFTGFDLPATLSLPPVAEKKAQTTYF